MRIDIDLGVGQLQEDATLSLKCGDRHFPYLFAGKGTYASSLRVYSMIMGDSVDDVHLFQVGRYSSIGINDQVLFNMNHDFDAVFQGVIPEFGDEVGGKSFREKLGQSERTLKQKGMVIIGNDVWIGNDVTILPGVVVGNGAIIGAGSVVTKDVPPYAVYAGNPARLIRYRFPDNVINGLQKIAWWNFDREKLLEAKNDMLGDVNEFVARYEPMASLCDYKGEYLPTLSDHTVPVMLLFIDILGDYPIFSRAIEQFITEFKDKSAELILVYHQTEAEQRAVEVITDTLEQLPYDVLISLVMADESEEEAIISEADCLFMSRDIRNIQRTNYAFKYGVKLLSPVDKPIFTDRVKRGITEVFERKRNNR